MQTFTEILASLDSVEHLRGIELISPGHETALIENKPGSQGSVKVYHHLWKEFGTISVEAARLGLELYAEHTADAASNPGKHPNIDRLFSVIANKTVLSVNILS